VVTGAFFMFINAMGWFRIDPLEEEVGMDISRHKGSAYDLTSASPDVVNKLNTSRSSRKIVLTDASDKNGNGSDQANEEKP